MAISQCQHEGRFVIMNKSVSSPLASQKWARSPNQSVKFSNEPFCRTKNMDHKFQGIGIRAASMAVGGDKRRCGFPIFQRAHSPMQKRLLFWCGGTHQSPCWGIWGSAQVERARSVGDQRNQRGQAACPSLLLLLHPLSCIYIFSYFPWCLACTLYFLFSRCWTSLLFELR